MLLIAIALAVFATGCVEGISGAGIFIKLYFYI